MVRTNSVLLNLFSLVGILFLPLFCYCQTQQPLFNPAKNLSKIGIQEIFNGDLSFYQERVLTNKIAAEVGIGMVFRNFIKNFFEENDISNQDKTLIGPSCNLKLKYYPYIPGEAFYLSTDYKFRRYRTQYSMIATTGGSTIVFNEFSQRNTLRFGIGFIQCLDEHFFIDYYSNLGLTSLLDRNIVPVFDPNTGNYEYTKDRFANVVLHFSVGVKFGYRF
jgi:hypothetical protein